MKRYAIKSVLLAAVAAVAIVAVACGGDDDGPPDADAAAGGGATIPVTQALLDALPDYEGATMVREWLEEGGRLQVREYAVASPPEQAADAVTRHFRDALVADGWQESEAHAAVTAFTKDSWRIVIGRVGPQIQEAPAGSALLSTAGAPAGTGFFYTLQAEEL
jgi:hypothetical protein